MLTKSFFSKVFILFFLFCASHSFSQTPPGGVTGQSLRTWFKSNYYDGKHNQLGYDNARRKMYNYIDNHNNTITGVYSGYQVSWTYGGTGTNPAPINCEHTIPQSFFGESEPMKSDIHHLFPTYQNWNSTRSNHPFDDIDDNVTAKWMRLSNSQTTIPTSLIDEYSEYANSTFEPREDHKGNVARAAFYFYTMYPTQAGAMSLLADINVLYQWHLNDPVDAAEITRNNAVELYQGDRNPYIDYPDFVDEAWNLTPAGPSAPTNLAFSSTSSIISITWSDVSDEDGYYVYRSTDNVNYSQVSTLSANTTYYDDSNVSSGNTYYYYLKAYNGTGTSSASSIVSGQLDQGSGGGGSASDLLISEYIEGSSYNKGLEIANFTGDAVNLSQYTLKKQANGAGSWGSDLTLNGILADGDVYILVNTSAASEMKAVADLITGSGVVTFNGNDPVGLFKSGVLIDIIGVFNGGSSNFAKDITLVRNSDITDPNSSYTTSEWTTYPSNTFTYFGSHTMDVSAPCGIPSGLLASNVTVNSVDLDWNTVAEANSYNIRYKATSSGTWINTTSSSSLKSVFGLNELTDYEFQVSTVCSSGNSDFSASVYFTTLETCDIASNLVAQNITINSADLNWNDMTNAQSYDVRYRETGAPNWTTQNTVNSYFNVSGLNSNTQHEFQVQTVCSAGDAGYSSSAYFTTDEEIIVSSELLISEYIEGSSYNKAIELYNFTGSSVNLADYTLKKQSNGAGTWSSGLALSGQLPSGDVYVIANSSAGSEIMAVTDLSTSSTVMSFNGNDPVGLFKNDVLVDMLGIFDGGSANFAVNTTIVRNLSITSPNTTYTEGEWDSYGSDTFDYIGGYGISTPTTTELVYTDFESGWDVWTDGGGDCSRYTSGKYAPQGNCAADIQDNSGTSSSFYLTNGIDIHTDNYTELTIDFSFYPRSMDNSNEDFFVEYYDGSSWNIVATYAESIDFENNNIYNVSVPVYEANYNFPSNMKIRFRCDASANYDDVYIDEIRITASTGGAQRSASIARVENEVINLKQTSIVEDITPITVNLYPNPASDYVNLDIESISGEEEILIQIYNLQGQLEYSKIVQNSDLGLRITLDVSDLNKGLHFVRIQTSKKQVSHKLLIK